jgi:hypothetical protein
LLRNSTDASILRFGAAWQDEQHRCSQQQAHQTHVERMQAISVSDVLEAVQRKDKCYWLRGWGMHAEESELQSILNQIWMVQEPRIIAKLLRVFSNRSLPRFDARIVEMCRHVDADVQRAALTALESNSHPQVRAFAIKELDEHALSFPVVGLFIKNFEAGDELRLLKQVDLPDSPWQRHSLLMDLIKVLEQNPGADCSKLAVIAYAETPCELCRFCAVRLLCERNAAPNWLIEESRYDASDECRDYVRGLPTQEPSPTAE